jgi:hypothetical protein
MPRFVRAVGAAKLGKPDVAKEEITQLQALSKAAENSYWSEQVHVLVLAASGWQAWAEGRSEEAVKLMRAAADLEDSAVSRRSPRTRTPSDRRSRKPGRF